MARNVQQIRNEMAHVFQLPPEHTGRTNKDAVEAFLNGKVLGDTLSGRHVTEFFKKNPELESQASETADVHDSQGRVWYLISKR